MRTDDSVTRVLNGRERVIRRARGYAPRPIVFPQSFAKPILACGGHYKNAFCLCKDRYAFMSQHIGDLENYETLTSFREGVEHFQNLFEIQPQVVAYDLHPDYLSSQFARELPGVEKVEVQHHHAHIASCMAEHGLKNDSVIGVAFDGTGYGADGAIWGGEFLLADYADFVRAAHLEYISLPGGDAAVREPWRSAAAVLHHVYGKEMEKLEIDFSSRLDSKRWSILKQMIQKNVNSSSSSSMGRLFDAVASLLGIRDVIHYEGQAAVELEQIADENCDESYDWCGVSGDFPITIGIRKLIRAIVDDIVGRIPVPRIACRFHNSVAEMTVSVCDQIRQKTDVDRVVLSGGVSQRRRDRPGTGRHRECEDSIIFQDQITFFCKRYQL
jgi:hydrogenase maturation protein HypF